jgi:hypothetical protein
MCVFTDRGRKKKEMIKLLVQAQVVGMQRQARTKWQKRQGLPRRGGRVRASASGVWSPRTVREYRCHSVWHTLAAVLFPVCSLLYGLWYVIKISLRLGGDAGGDIIGATFYAGPEPIGKKVVVGCRVRHCDASSVQFAGRSYFHLMLGNSFGALLLSL